MVKRLSYATIIIATLALSLYSANKPHLPADPQALYATFNEMYFDNRLPKDAVVEAGETPSDKPGEIIFGSTEHTIDTHQYLILISVKYNPALTLEEGTVLHEMCHTEIWEETQDPDIAMGHGPAFQNCMMRLAQKNAFHDIW